MQGHSTRPLKTATEKQAVRHARDLLQSVLPGYGAEGTRDEQTDSVGYATVRRPGEAVEACESP